MAKDLTLLEIEHLPALPDNCNRVNLYDMNDNLLESVDWYTEQFSRKYLDKVVLLIMPEDGNLSVVLSD